MFDRLSQGFNNVFRRLSGRGTITESNVREALEEVRTALLEADTALDVVNEFCDRVLADALGRDVTRIARAEMTASATAGSSSCSWIARPTASRSP